MLLHFLRDGQTYKIRSFLLPDQVKNWQVIFKAEVHRSRYGFQAAFENISTIFNVSIT
jgi:hypothetical protein